MDDEVHGDPRYDRHEPVAARADRNFNELLQEIRVLQTGSQILAAFLVVLPFQSRFAELDEVQVRWYLGVLTLSLLIVAVLLTPVAIHRALFGRRIKDEIVLAVGRIVRIALVLLSLLLVGVAVLVVDVVVGRGAALAAGVAAAAIVLVLQVLVPWIVARSS
ncbi:DUF6328 family protein [Brachybacterium sp. AOP25-B2-12]|uniref:DUF6328 family protein n=1 Tax=Brachybacterium sp. AOP25-B2-12 TaxID=3457710 RepID=UPI0040348B8A